MKKELLLITVIAAAALCGCGSSDAVVQTAAPSNVNKSGVPDTVRGNPNIPDSAKRAMQGQNAK